MEIKGKCIAVLPLTQGEGKNGAWKSQDFVIETFDQYPKKVCLNAFGDKIQFIPKVGETVEASFDIESREYNGRWFTTIRAWQIKKDGSASSATQQPTAATTPPTESVPDLPF